MSLAAPTTADPALVNEVERRSVLVHEANVKAAEATRLASLCLNTAQQMEWTLGEYRRALDRR